MTTAAETSFSSHPYTSDGAAPLFVSSDPQPSPSYVISVYSHSRVDQSLLMQCAELFSSYYGVWSKSVQPPLRPASRVTMSAARMRASLLFDDTCGVVVYREAGHAALLGQAFHCTLTVPGVGDVLWITQLLVASQHRRRGIAERMLQRGKLEHNKQPLFTAGLASSNPAAVRALEAAARCRASAESNLRYAPLIHQNCTVPYVREGRLTVSETQCTVDTGFHVDHTELLMILHQLRHQRPGQWILDP